MHGYQHKRMGVAAGIGVLAYTIMSGFDTAAIISIATIPMGAMLPDIDHDRSKVGRVRKKAVSTIKTLAMIGILAFIGFSYYSGGLWNAVLNSAYVGGMALIIWVITRNKHVKKQLGFMTKHRGIMHTLIPPAFILGTTFWTTNPVFTFGIYGLVFGYVVHLLGDMATEEGSPILWPLLKANVRYSSFNTNRSGGAIEFVCNVWCVLFVAVGIYFGYKGGF